MGRYGLTMQWRVSSKEYRSLGLYYVGVFADASDKWTLCVLQGTITLLYTQYIEYMGYMTTSRVQTESTVDSSFSR